MRSPKYLPYLRLYERIFISWGAWNGGTNFLKFIFFFKKIPRPSVYLRIYFIASVDMTFHFLQWKVSRCFALENASFKIYLNFVKLVKTFLRVWLQILLRLCFPLFPLIFSFIKRYTELCIKRSKRPWNPLKETRWKNSFHRYACPFKLA